MPCSDERKNEKGGREGGREETYESDAVDTLVLHALMDDARVPCALVLVLAVNKDLGREGGREGGKGGLRATRKEGDSGPRRKMEKRKKSSHRDSILWGLLDERMKRGEREGRKEGREGGQGTYHAIVGGRSQQATPTGVRPGNLPDRADVLLDSVRRGGRGVVVVDLEDLG